MDNSITAMNAFNRRDGFTGQRMIVIPNRLIHKIIRTDPLLEHLYITQIGYFPNAMFHYRERRYGCADNILLYCTRGKGWYVIGKTRFEISANQYVILPATDAYIRYGADNMEPWTIYWIHFTGTMIELLNKTLNITAQSGPHSIPYRQATLDLWLTMYQHLEKTQTREQMLIARILLNAFIASVLFDKGSSENTAPGSGKIIEAAICHMKKSIGERLSVETFAARSNLSVSYFTKLFKEETGKAPMEYFIELKMQHACTLLESTKMKIKQIALLVGYDDPYYFSRIFKKVTKNTPRTYMRISQAAL